MWCCKDEDDSFKLKGDFSYNDHAVVGDVIVSFVSCYNQIICMGRRTTPTSARTLKMGFHKFYFSICKCV